MPAMELIRPNGCFKDSYLAAEEELAKEGLTLLPPDYSLAEVQKDFGRFVADLKSFARGENLPKNYVPMTILWLIDKNEFIGRVKIRHSLNEYLNRFGGHIGYTIRPSKRRQGYGTKILELALVEAKKMGFSKILLTCDVGNIASQKIIERNGGMFESQMAQGGGRPDKLRFWIDLD